MPSDELFYLDAQGQKQDRALHESLLGDDVLRDAMIEQTILDAMQRYGGTREECERRYGRPARGA